MNVNQAKLASLISTYYNNREPLDRSNTPIKSQGEESTTIIYNPLY